MLIFLECCKGIYTKHIYTNYTVSEYYCQNTKQSLLSRLITTNERTNTVTCSNM